MGYARVGSNPAHSVWGISSNGRALALHARGRGIDALILQLWLLTATNVDSLVVKRGIYAPST